MAQEQFFSRFFGTVSLEQALHGDHGPLCIILTAFGAGMLVSFTPCIYPMVPITLGILQTYGATSFIRQFFLTLLYVCGIATTYAVLGYVAATSAQIFGVWFASPWFVAFMVGFFLYFAFSMFGWYDIYFPSISFHPRVPRIKGSFFSAYFFGLLAGTVTSPCLTPALAIILGFVAQQKSTLLGFLALFAFGFGLGTLLLIVGTFSNVIHRLPRAGKWTVEVKKLIGFLLIAVCIHMASPFMKEWESTGYGILLLVMAFYYSTVLNSMRRVYGTRITVDELSGVRSSKAWQKYLWELIGLVAMTAVIIGCLWGAFYLLRHHLLPFLPLKT
jgi:thiol:disulfide interchange protein